MVNKCTFIGNMGKAAEVKKTESGHLVATFSIACSERRKKKDTEEVVEQTEWINIVAWDALAEIIQRYTSKGSQLYIEGKFRTRSYEDNQGVKRYISEIWAKEIKLLGSRKESAPAPSSPDGPGTQPAEPIQTPAIEDDGLPF